MGVWRKTGIFYSHFLNNYFICFPSEASIFQFLFVLKLWKIWLGEPTKKEEGGGEKWSNSLDTWYSRVLKREKKSTPCRNEKETACIDGGQGKFSLPSYLKSRLAGIKVSKIFGNLCVLRVSSGKSWHIFLFRWDYRFPGAYLHVHHGFIRIKW